MMNHLLSGFDKYLGKLENQFDIRIECDEDGWLLQVNDEPGYNHFTHTVSPNKIRFIQLSGDVMVNFVGFGPKGKTI